MSTREIKHKARRDLHEGMKVPVLYIVGEADPIETYCRVHSFKRAQVGDDFGFHFAAERTSIQPTLVWLRSEAPNLVRNAVVSVEEGEAYRIELVDPPDGITVSTPAAKLSEAQAAGLPIPGIWVPPIEGFEGFTGLDFSESNNSGYLPVIGA